VKLTEYAKGENLVFTKDVMKKLFKKFGTISKVEKYGKSGNKFNIYFEPSKDDKKN
jgi:hypothetical protein